MAVPITSRQGRGSAPTGRRALVGVLVVAGLVGVVASIAPRGPLTIATATQVWVVDADGTRATEVTRWSSAALPMDWSPDGEWLLVQSDRDGDWDLWLIAADGTRERQLTNQPGMESFARFSPDGTAVVFTNDMAGDADLWTIGVDGDGLAPLVGGVGSQESNPAWSPDGESVLFVRTPREAPAAGELWTVGIHGTNARRVELGSPVAWVDASRDASRLVVATAAGSLSVVQVDSMDADRLGDTAQVWHPRFLADETIVAAVGGHPLPGGLLGAGPEDARDLWLFDATGRATLLLQRAGDQALPVPSPDGSRIAFAETPEAGR